MRKFIPEDLTWSVVEKLLCDFDLGYVIIRLLDLSSKFDSETKAQLLSKLADRGEFNHLTLRQKYSC